MDVEPIYCAEQIVVPIDLADVLKAFTKEVIRRQPENLVEFSAKYFANLANIAGSLQEAATPTREQLKLVCQRAEGAKALSLQHIEALCTQADIQPSIVARVAEAGKFETDMVEVDKFLFLLLAMTCDSFKTVTAGIFELFGDELEATRFIALIGYLAPDMDPDVTTQFLAELSTSLMDVPRVTHLSVLNLDVLKEKLSQ
jgi:hypothetical protein